MWLLLLIIFCCSCEINYCLWGFNNQTHRPVDKGYLEARYTCSFSPNPGQSVSMSVTFPEKNWSKADRYFISEFSFQEPKYSYYCYAEATGNNFVPKTEN
jgi:hypothetical protein